MELISTRKCMARDVGFNGNLFGGQMLAWLDEAAVAYACQVCETPRMVTAKMSEVEFLKPVRTGQIIKIYGSVKTFGDTSAIFDIQARRRSPYNGSEKLVCSTTMTFVRIDGDGEPVTINPYIKERYNTE